MIWWQGKRWVITKRCIFHTMPWLLTKSISVLDLINIDNKYAHRLQNYPLWLMKAPNFRDVLRLVFSDTCISVIWWKYIFGINAIFLLLAQFFIRFNVSTLNPKSNNSPSYFQRIFIVLNKCKHFSFGFYDSSSKSLRGCRWQAIKRLMLSWNSRVNAVK